jgi:hypothetical protein
MKCFLLILFTALSYGINAQTGGTVRGFVFDKTTGEPMANREMYLGNNYFCFTNTSGLYSFVNIAPGNYVLKAKTGDYDSTTVNVTIVEGKVLEQNIYAYTPLKFDSSISYRTTKPIYIDGVELQKIKPIKMSRKMRKQYMATTSFPHKYKRQPKHKLIGQ